MAPASLEHKHPEVHECSVRLECNTCEEVQVLEVQELVSGTEDWGSTGDTGLAGEAGRAVLGSCPGTRTAVPLSRSTQQGDMGIPAMEAFLQ